LRAQGVSFSDVTHLILTHIHLDHAGATGVIVRQHPHLKVVVHRRGARHLADPSKLLESATRLYGADMDRFWGEVAAVPEDRLIVLEGGERLQVGGRTFEVAYTPGHASHHVSYFDPSSGVAFVGDTAGVCIDGGYVLPPTPAPDIDLELWRDSVERIEAWQPQTMFLTHFGPVTEVRPHLQALLEHLNVFGRLVKESLQQAGTDEERSQRFAEEIRRELRRQMPEERVAAYKVAAPLEMMWFGLARYFRGKEIRG
jgi:glyoxylase-like metal-dependent hydrolase (beta-lactamase superfamily II)